MTPAAAATSEKTQLPWSKVAWFGLLICLCYAPVISRLVRQWANDDDMRECNDCDDSQNHPTALDRTLSIS